MSNGHLDETAMQDPPPTARDPQGLHGPTDPPPAHDGLSAARTVVDRALLVDSLVAASCLLGCMKAAHEIAMAMRPDVKPIQGIDELQADVDRLRLAVLACMGPTDPPPVDGPTDPTPIDKAGA